MHPEFAVQRTEVRDGLELAYWREGAGGFPLLLVHGWPETKRIWARNVAALAEAGFEVIVPDLRGYGDSALAADGFYDLAAHARDLEALVRGLGHERCAACGGDLGGGAIQDMGLRFEGFVVRQVLFNTVLPLLPELPREQPADVRMAADYFRRQGREADALAAELDSAEKRIRYVSEFYGHRFWATPGAFTREDAHWHAEPFGDGDKLRASFGNYESAVGARRCPSRRGSSSATRCRRCPVRPGRPRAVARLPRALRDRLHGPGRAVRRAARRALPPGRARRPPEQDADRVFAGPLLGRPTIR